MNHDNSSTDHDQVSFNRRGLFRIGGLTVTTAALMAACGKNPAGQVGRVGDGPPTPTLPGADVNNGIYLRTMASIETSIAIAYDRMVKSGVLAASSSTFPNLGDQTAMVKAFADHHRTAADAFNALAVKAGATAWTCGNAHLDNVFLTPIFDRVDKGATATDVAKAIEPSDDATRDMINLVVALENLSAESCQALVALVTEAQFRAEPMKYGVRSSRQAALAALKVAPGAYVAATDASAAQPGVTTTTEAVTTTTAAPAGSAAAPPPTEIPLPVAIPSTFGSLAPVTYVGGHGDENGVRLKFNFETPSLNSYVYAYATCK
jgi:hypothetical protein